MILQQMQKYKKRLKCFEGISWCNRYVTLSQFDHGSRGDYTTKKYETEETEPSDEEIRKMFGF